VLENRLFVTKGKRAGSVAKSSIAGRAEHHGSVSRASGVWSEWSVAIAGVARFGEADRGPGIADV
jgi:hypothetical protein